MRLICSFEDEKEAVDLSSFLSREGIENSLESGTDPSGKKKVFHLWIFSEDDLEKAEKWIREYKENPKDPRFTPSSLFEVSKKVRQVEEEAEKEAMEGPLRYSRRPPSVTWGLTVFLILICAAFFILDGIQRKHLNKEVPLTEEQLLLWTPIEQTLLFDYPKHAELMQQFFLSHPVANAEELKQLPVAALEQYKTVEATPYWQGIYPFLFPNKEPSDAKGAPLFEKIREGEVWRLFTPVFLHGGFLHIIFNMLWLWYLGKQIEPRLGKWRFLLLSILIGVVANCAQYLMSGPLFFGYSGIVVGLVGFIWMRQRIAPWEGYPLQQSIVLFLLFFILAMAALQVFGYVLEFLSISDLSANIGNTAHIVGGLVGIFLGKLPYFARKKA